MWQNFDNFRYVTDSYLLLYQKLVKEALNVLFSCFQILSVAWRWAVGRNDDRHIGVPVGPVHRPRAGNHRGVRVRWRQLVLKAFRTIAHQSASWWVLKLYYTDTYICQMSRFALKASPHQVSIASDFLSDWFSSLQDSFVSLGPT